MCIATQPQPASPSEVAASLTTVHGATYAQQRSELLSATQAHFDSVVAALRALLSSVACAAATPPTYSESVDLLARVNQASATRDDRLAAENRLHEATDVRLLAHLFHEIDEPVPGPPPVGGGPPAPVRPDEAVASYTMPLAIEFESRLPVGAQIVFARRRLWDHFCTQLGTADQRASALASLFVEADAPAEVRALLDGCNKNWTGATERKVLDLIGDASANIGNRVHAVRLLCTQSRMSDRPDLGEAAIAAAWSSRGTRFAHLSTKWLSIGPADDPRTMVLLIESVEDLRRQSNGEKDWELLLQIETIERYANVNFDPPSTTRSPRGSASWKLAKRQAGVAWGNENKNRYVVRAQRFEPH